MGEVTCGRLPHLSCKSDQIKMRDYMNRRVTSPKEVTSAYNWGPPSPFKQALRLAKTTTLHVNHGFCTFFLPSSHDYNVKVLYFTFCRGRGPLEFNSRKIRQHLTN